VDGVRTNLEGLNDHGARGLEAGAGPTDRSDSILDN
jgi:hypothetical protein